MEYENTEQKENKAKGERMRLIIERQMNAEYQNSVNKILDGAQMNQLGVVATKSAQAQKGKRAAHLRERTGTVKADRNGGPWEELQVRDFADDDEALLRKQQLSLHLQPRPNETGSFVNAGVGSTKGSIKKQAGSYPGGGHLQPGVHEDANGFYANDRADDAAFVAAYGDQRGKHQNSRRSQYSNASMPGREEQ